MKAKKKEAPAPGAAAGRMGRPPKCYTTLARAMVEQGWTNRSVAKVLGTHGNEVNLWRQGKPISKPYLRIMSIVIPTLPKPDGDGRRWRLHARPLPIRPEMVVAAGTLDVTGATDDELAQAAA